MVELGRDGLSMVQIAVELGVPRQTMLSWGDVHPDFSAALTYAKDAAQAWWERKGTTGLDAERFNALVWKVSMQARFRDDYTERRVQEVGGIGGGPVKTETRIDVSQMTDAERVALAGAIGKAGVKLTDEE